VCLSCASGVDDMLKVTSISDSQRSEAKRKGWFSMWYTKVSCRFVNGAAPPLVRELLRRIFTGFFRDFPPDWPLIRISTRRVLQAAASSSD